MSPPAFYTNRESAAAGESVTIHASAALSPCRLEITRVGQERDTVAVFDGIEVAEHVTPEDVEMVGCGWPAAFSFAVGHDWQQGYYDLRLVQPDGAASHHYFVVIRSAATPKAAAVLVLNTNTYLAYNYWGGANCYAHVAKLMVGEVDAPGSEALAVGRLSRQRPFPQNLLLVREGQRRLINAQPRGFAEVALPGDPAWFAANHPTPYDGSAGFVGKWEHAFVAWAEAQGLAFDYLTDHDCEAGAGILNGYRAAILVGHSEYWSGKARDAVDSLHEAGGNLICLSGNTAYWKVRWEDDGQTMVTHKWRGEEDDPLWADPATRAEATHLWSHPAFARPEAEMTGLSFLYGGYHRLGRCVGRGSAGYTVHDDRHWALEGCDLFYGDMIGGDLPLIGYENDGCPIRIDDRGLPAPNGGLGVPQDLAIIATAPATLYEDPDTAYPTIIPPGDAATLARIAYGVDTTATRERLVHGNAVMATFRRGAGEVFNAGTTEWVHGLEARNVYIERITRNVFSRFGVPIPESPG
jgi:hypothetical protein